MVTFGFVMSTTCVQPTVAWFETVLVLPSPSCATPAGTPTTTFPDVVMPDTSIWNTVGPPDTLASSEPPAVDPVKLTSVPSNPVTFSSKVAVRVIGEVDVG